MKRLGVWAILSLVPIRIFDRLHSTENLYVVAYKNAQNQFAVAITNAQGEIVKKYPLPNRGHSTAISYQKRYIVTFARRPGNFALAIDCMSKKPPIFFQTPAYAHFYGHGVFSKDGQLLYATENKFAEGNGIIGIYNTKKQFERIGELSTYGIGPHEIILMPDGNTLCVANGGILTHPDTGRTKLNLHEMQSTVVFIDSKTGKLQSKHAVPNSIRRLSLRHLDVATDGKVWLGGQYQGDVREQVPLVASLSESEGLYFLPVKRDALSSLSNYIGSVACHSHKDLIAFSSPRGNTVITLNSQGRVFSHTTVEKVCGLSEYQDGFLYTSMTGQFGSRQGPYYRDNHITAIKQTV